MSRMRFADLNANHAKGNGEVGNGDGQDDASPGLGTEEEGQHEPSEGVVPGKNLLGGATDLLEARVEDVVPGLDLGEGRPLPEEEGPGVGEEDGGDGEGPSGGHPGGLDGVEVEAVHHPDEE